MAVVTPTPIMQFIDAAGVPLAGGLLYTYAAGTTTPQATYTDSTGATANTNPIVLNSRGEAGVWLGSATYKFKLCDSNGTEIWTVDYISAPTSALSPVLSGNVIIDTDSSNAALTINQSGLGPLIKSQDTITSTPLFYVTRDGYVGVNTASPANAIDVTGGGIQISSSGGAARTVISADSADSIYAVSDDRNFTVKTNGVTQLTLNSSSAAFTVPITTTAVTASGTITAATFSGAWADIPAGTVMLFVQTAAPTGWTKSTTHTNKALRVVSGAASSGGSVAFTSAFASQAVTGTNASYTLTTSDIPAHSHTATSTVTDLGHAHAVYKSASTGSGTGGGGLFVDASGSTVDATVANTTGITVATTIANTGGGGGHTHSFTGTAINLAVQYVDVIIATKN